MGPNDNLRPVALFFVFLLFALCVVPYSYSKGVSVWTFYGNVTDGASCKPLVGVVVSASYNNNAANITNSSGGYTLLLGYGSWNVTFSKSGYKSLVFATPNELAGAYRFNAYLVPNGASQVNCTSRPPSTSSTAIYTTKATTVAADSTTVPSELISNQSVSTQIKSLNNYSLFELGAVLFLIIVVIIVLAAYLVPKIKDGFKRKPKPKTGP